MEGTRPITLRQPNPTGEVTALTASAVFGPPVLHRTLAEKEDGVTGALGEIASGVRGGDWETKFTIREESVWPRPTEAWTLVDEDDQEYEIERVSEVGVGARSRRLVLVCARRETKGDEA